jgi:cytochrome P450
MITLVTPCQQDGVKSPSRELHPTLARARSRCPVARSDAYGGFWVVTRYEDVLRIAQDWRTFSSELASRCPLHRSR